MVEIRKETGTQNEIQFLPDYIIGSISRIKYIFILAITYFSVFICLYINLNIEKLINTYTLFIHAGLLIKYP